MKRPACPCLANIDVYRRPAPATRPSLLLLAILTASLLGPRCYADASLEFGRMGPGSSATHGYHDLEADDEIVGPQAHFLDSGVMLVFESGIAMYMHMWHACRYTNQHHVDASLTLAAVALLTYVLYVHYSLLCAVRFQRLPAIRGPGKERYCTSRVQQHIQLLRHPHISKAR